MQSYTATKLYQTMTTSATPIAIGTRGTVGSLLRKEIEYFKNFDRRYVDQQKCSSDGNNNVNHQGGWIQQRFWFFRKNWRRKKRRSRGCRGGGSGSGFLPLMCSATDVSDGDRIPGFNYRILQSHEKG